MKMEDLQTFLTVVRTGSVTKASEQMFVTQPTLTYRIQSLEKSLGYQLVERSRGQHQISLTPEGREFYVIAEKMESLWKEGRDISSPLPSFRVAATYALNYYVMPSVCASFWSRNLPLSMEMRAMHYNKCYAGIENRTLDAAITTRTISSSITPVPIWEDKMVMICSKNSRFSGMIHPSELDPEKGIFIHWSPESSKWHDYWFGPTNYKIKSDNIRLSEKLLCSNPEYWSIAPLPIVKIIEEYTPLKHVDIAGDAPGWPIYLLSLQPDNRYCKLLVEDFKNYIMRYSK